MPAYVTALNSLLDDFGGNAAYVSLHTAGITDPTNPNEISFSAGTPNYARKAVTWNSAATANLDSSNSPVLDVPAGTTVTWVGFWSDATAKTAATFMASLQLTTGITFATQGTLTFTDIDWSAA